MYLVNLKTAIVDALRNTFTLTYPEQDFNDVNITLEYPMQPQNYPGIWVNFRDDQPVVRAGIAHVETVIDDDGIFHQVSRWRFGGTLSLTVAALSSLERDRLFDQVVRILMTSDVDDTDAGQFKHLIEENEFLGVNLNYDEISVSGEAASPGTPWETNEVLYEKTIDISLIGEFVSDPAKNTLVPLSRIIFIGYNDEDQDNPFPQEADGSDWNPSEWS